MFTEKIKDNSRKEEPSRNKKLPVNAFPDHALMLASFHPYALITEISFHLVDQNTLIRFPLNKNLNVLSSNSF